MICTELDKGSNILAIATDSRVTLIDIRNGAVVR